MNVTFIEVAADGRILRIGVCPKSEILLQKPVETGATIMVGQTAPNPDAEGGFDVTAPLPQPVLAEPSRYWFDGTDLTPRPSLEGLRERRRMAVGSDWSLPAIPAGSKVSIDGGAPLTLDADGLTLRFDVQDAYAVRIEPPFPWLAAEIAVEAV